MSLFQPATWSVGEITRFMRDLLESEANLQDLWVGGEVSNISSPSSGHLYFTLKDREAALRCVMWRNQVAKLVSVPRDGDAVEVHGSISIYEASGNYQLYADMIRPAGEGALYQEFMRLKAKLETQGFFDPQRKRSLPPWPRTIGIVTSPTGAALQDIYDTLKRRFPLVRVVLAPSRVQGSQAAAGIIGALEALNNVVKPDLIIVARGGGSIEDLMAFNDEGVALAIADSQAPVITGIGHETDFTIADFVADLRAPTPTAAAELATPDQEELHTSIIDLRRDLSVSMTNSLSEMGKRLEINHDRLLNRTPLSQVQRDQQRLDDLSHRSARASIHTIDLYRTRLAGLSLQLQSLDPRAILQRGYSIVTQPDGSLVRSIRQVQGGDNLRVQVSDGDFPVQVRESQEKGK